MVVCLREEDGYGWAVKMATIECERRETRKRERETRNEEKSNAKKRK